MDPTNLLIAVIVIGSRLFVPLLIPRFPLPAIIACLLIDGIDQTIFQKYTTIDLSGYQSYDKALDIYYLTIAYLSTFRNWTNRTAFRISQFLFYYRIIGVVLFEISQNRNILFIFPNTFEYFFIFYSAAALFWNTKRMTSRFLIGSAAFIWIFIKLPQEYWIHIAQLDTTDFIKEKIFHVPVTTSFEQIFVIFPWLIPAIGIFTLILGIIVWKLAKRLPKPDHSLMISPFTEKIAKSIDFKTPKSFFALLQKYRYEFAEKIILVGLISFIFAQIFPNLRGTNIEILFGVTLVILVNAVFGYIVIRSSKLNISILDRFFPMLVLNTFVALIYSRIMSSSDSSLNFLTILFFGYIITLLTVLYDRFRPYYQERNLK